MAVNCALTPGAACTQLAGAKVGKKRTHPSNIWRSELSRLIAPPDQKEKGDPQMLHLSPLLQAPSSPVDETSRAFKGLTVFFIFAPLHYSLLLFCKQKIKD